MIRCGLFNDIHYGFNMRASQVLADYFKTYIAKEHVDLWMVAGDIATNDQEQIYKCFKFLRKYLPLPIPILVVYGNHDYWHLKRDYKRGRLTYREVEALHREWEQELGIHYLPGNPFVHEDVIFLGFDGWYGTTMPPTNDQDNLAFQWVESAPAMSFMQNRAHLQLDELLKVPTDQYRKVVGLSHFPLYSDSQRHENLVGNLNHLKFITEKCDIFCFGHSHRQEVKIIDDCLMLSPGGGTFARYLPGTEKAEKIEDRKIMETYSAPRHMVFNV